VIEPLAQERSRGRDVADFALELPVLVKEQCQMVYVSQDGLAD
jgi:hypothetical protein